ncbi:MAG: sugar phosphate isomerase/epimerase [Firmicutes bacterium]|jgi:sugar phosphate isomerase/epimerase|nr:sugar phosphate isomerase/epimerase [Bacillota bacterium]
MREKLFIATFCYDAVAVIKAHGLQMEVNHTCISQDLEQENRPTLLAAIKRDMTGSDARQAIVHGPFTEIYPAGIDPLARQMGRRRLEDGFSVCRAAAVNRMVVHSGYVPFIYFKEWQAEKSALFWQDFMRDKPADFGIYIENVLEDEPYMLANMMKQIDDPRIKLCLDVGHAAAAGKNMIPITQWIRVLGPWLGHFHLHNNYGDRDSHGAFHDGTMDFHQIFQAVDDYCQKDATFTIESRDCAASVAWLLEKGYLT